MVYRILLRTIQKRAELATLKQQHFLYQRKVLYNQEPSRSSSGETIPEDDYKTSWLKFFISIPVSPCFICGSVAPAGRAVERGTARSASGLGHPTSTVICRKGKVEYKDSPVRKPLEEFMVTLRIFSGCVMDSKVHCLSRKASYALFIHVFNRLNNSHSVSKFRSCFQIGSL